MATFIVRQTFHLVADDTEDMKNCLTVATLWAKINYYACVITSKPTHRTEFNDIVCTFEITIKTIREKGITKSQDRLNTKKELTSNVCNLFNLHRVKVTY